LELEAIRELTELATGDKGLAEQTFVDAYEKRLWASVEREEAKSGHEFSVS
jgi:hypothetical protein